MIERTKKAQRGHIILIALSMMFVAATVLGQVVTDQPEELKHIDIVEKLGQKIPLDLTFTNDLGQQVRLGDYFHKGKPVVLTLAYYECPMLCSMVLNGLSAAVTKLAWTPGDEFTMLTVSIKPTETAELAHAKKLNYAASVGKPGTQDGWTFFVGEESQSQALAEALGFKYYKVEETGEYAHPAAVFVLTENGVLSRVLYGIEFSERDLRLSLLEASEGKIGSPLDKLILYCFHYDPNAKGYVVFAGNLMRLGGALSAGALGVFLALLWRRDRVRQRREAGDAAPGTVGTR